MLTREIIYLVIAFLGTSIGTFAGIIQGNKLTGYRLKQLEEKMDKHNKMQERLQKIEFKVDNLMQHLNL